MLSWLRSWVSPNHFHDGTLKFNKYYDKQKKKSKDEGDDKLANYLLTLNQ